MPVSAVPSRSRPSVPRAAVWLDCWLPSHRLPSPLVMRGLGMGMGVVRLATDGSPGPESEPLLGEPGSLRHSKHIAVTRPDLILNKVGIWTPISWLTWVGGCVSQASLGPSVCSFRAGVLEGSTATVRTSPTVRGSRSASHPAARRASSGRGRLARRGSH